MNPSAFVWHLNSYEKRGYRQKAARIMKELRRFAVGLLAIGGFLGILFHVLRSLVFLTVISQMPDDATVVGSYLSPDNAFKAVVYNENGGGAFAPYCFDYVAVVPASVPDKMAWGDDYEVFVASCNSITFGNWAKDVRWLTGKALQIAFDPTVGSKGIAALKLKGNADHGHIEVSYTQR